MWIRDPIEFEKFSQVNKGAFSVRCIKYWSLPSDKQTFTFKSEVHEDYFEFWLETSFLTFLEGVLSRELNEKTFEKFKLSDFAIKDFEFQQILQNFSSKCYKIRRILVHYWRLFVKYNNFDFPRVVFVELTWK